MLLYCRQESTATLAPVLTKVTNAEQRMRRHRVLSVFQIGQQIWKLPLDLFTQGVFPLHHSVPTTCGATQPKDDGDLLPGVKWSGREADPLISNLMPNLKNAWSFTLTAPYVMSLCFITSHRKQVHSNFLIIMGYVLV
jgi:hypothetical protein